MIAEKVEKISYINELVLRPPIAEKNSAEIL